GCNLVALYITSSESSVGKTAICAGLGKYLLDDGKKVGFLKPIITDSKNLSPGSADSDAVFMKQIFALDEPLGLLCPVITEKDNLVNKIRDTYERVSSGKDVVIVEGVCGLGSDTILERASYAMAEALCAKVIIVERYSSYLSQGTFADIYKEFGDFLFGVVLNEVPKARSEQVHKETSAQDGGAGVNILGILPEDRALFALTVAELAQDIQGDILNNAEKSDELIENFMLGAKQVDPGPEYYGRKINKAVVVRSERPDMQMAALETPTKCLVVSGDVPLTPGVLYQAEVKNIPVISARADISSIATSIEDALDKSKFNQEKKLRKLGEIMKQFFDFQSLYKGLGLAG
ncbi:AAA family ATPase, partial [Chloroflexota bacterium]